MSFFFHAKAFALIKNHLFAPWVMEYELYMNFKFTRFNANVNSKFEITTPCINDEEETRFRFRAKESLSPRRGTLSIMSETGKIQ